VNVLDDEKFAVKITPQHSVATMAHWRLRPTPKGTPIGQLRLLSVAVVDK